MMDIHPILYWEHLGLAGGLGVSIFVLCGLVLRLYDVAAPRMHIWSMLAFFAVNMIDLIAGFVYSDVFDGPPMFRRWNDVLIPTYMVALYLYVRALTSSVPGLRRADIWHLVPYGLSFVCLLPILALPGEVRQSVVETAELPDPIAIAETAFWALWVVILCVYGALCIRRLIQHKANVRAVFSDIEGKTLVWLDALVATILVLALVVIVDELGQLAGRAALRDGVWSLVYDLALPIGIGLFALRASPPLPDWSAPVVEQAPSPPERAQSARYARSGLLPEDLDRYALRLERRMAEGQLWRNHGLNLAGLAREISIAPIHLSEVLNTRLGMSFYDYVNQCRIQDACTLLIQTDATVLEICETVGFNAKSTFNTSFKKVTGQTPSHWRAAQQV